MHQISVVGRSNHSQFINCLVTAFASDPMARYAFPTASNYLAAWPEVMTEYVGSGIEDETIWFIGDFHGVAAWLAPGCHQDDEKLGPLIEKHVPADRLEEMFAVFEKLAAYHPSEPHWYLPVIGVDPASRGNGLGSQLLEHTLRMVDEKKLPVYLESTNPANVPLYERFGFVVQDRLSLGGSPMVTPMIRPGR